MENKIIIDGIEVDKFDFDEVNKTIRDSGESAFFVRELEFIKSKSYDTKQSALKAMMLLPVSYEVDPGAETITWRRYTDVGTAAIVSDYAENSPRSDVYGVEFSSKVYTVSNSFGYSRQEIRRSKLTGKNLDARRAKAAKRAFDEKIDTIAWSGDTAHSINGFIGYPGITQYVVPNGAAGTATWITKTPDEIIKDIKGMLLAVTDTTNGIEEPDTLILPYAQYMDIATRRVTDGDSKTVLNYIKENFPMIKNIEWVIQLKAAGLGATDMMMMYPKNPDNIVLEIPMTFQMLPPQVKGLGFEILTEGRVGGVVVHYPLSISYGIGI
jgi:hypothetical protein